MQACGRFAPSPTGDLHAGSVVAALGSYVCAKARGGQWRVRIEDVDRTREVQGAAERQLQQLAWLGLQADGAIIRQSRRGDLYQSMLSRLAAEGHAFECHCSRSDLAAQGGIHRACLPDRKRPDPAWRLRVPDGCVIAFNDTVHGAQVERVDEAVGDFVLKRADGYWAYQLAVVVDDAAQQITDVVRGSDLLNSTARQIFLQQCLGFPTPAYTHLPLLLDPQGAKLSKSLDSKAISAERAPRILCETWAFLGQKTLFTPTSETIDTWLMEAIDAFDVRQIPTGPVRS